MNVVCNAFPFHMICDWGTKSLPFTVSRTDAASPGMAPGESELIWGCGTEPSQLLKSTIALQVVQQANSRVRAAMKAIRTKGKGLRDQPGKNAYSLPITSISYCNLWGVVTFGARPCALPSNDNPWLTSAAIPNPELLRPQAAAELRGRARAPVPTRANPTLSYLPVASLVANRCGRFAAKIFSCATRRS